MPTSSKKGLPVGLSLAHARVWAPGPGHAGTYNASPAFLNVAALGLVLKDDPSFAEAAGAHSLLTRTGPLSRPPPARGPHILPFSGPRALSSCWLLR